MIDPITAVAMATSAFKTVQKMVSMGREIEDTLGQVGKWYGAVSDFNEAKRQAENPPIFRRLIASKSVEQEAMEMYAHDKRIKQQETELRELLMYTYGPDAYKELLGMRRKIREQREKTLYAQERKRKAFIWNGVAFIFIGIMVYSLYIVGSLIVERM
jgi:GrpB-like predicted nucleotidyltransferase (UPF0157 family)